MAGNDDSSACVEERLFTNPWPALIGGLAATVLGFLWIVLFHFSALPLVIGGLLATGTAVAIRPQSSVVLGLFCLSGLCAMKGLPLDWDSARLLMAVLSTLAAFAAFVMLLPRVFRRIIVSLMILFHFGGILSAVNNVPPCTWLSTIAWTHIFRPYLEFMYLNNAYHFYSPEPGPGGMIWFYAKFEDGIIQEYKIPNRDENPLALEYQRRLSFVESVNAVSNPAPVPEATSYLRRFAGQNEGIYLHPEIGEEFQYRVPNFYSRRMLQTYARYVARHIKHPTDPEKKVTSVKIYRIVHKILLPKQINEGVKPDEEWLYLPYYQGEFDPDGNLMNPQDPYLYWLIPILRNPIRVTRVPNEFVKLLRGGEEGKDEFVSNFLERHVRLQTTSIARHNLGLEKDGRKDTAPSK